MTTIAEIVTPPAVPERKPARLTLTSRAKMGRARTTPKAGKQIGGAAAKRKAEAEAKPVARAKEAQDGFAADARIKRLKTIKERCGTDPKCKPGSERRATFELYKDGMTVAEFIKAGGKLGNLKRDVRYKHISVGSSATPDP